MRPLVLLLLLVVGCSPSPLEPQCVTAPKPDSTGHVTVPVLPSGWPKQPLC